MPNRLASESSPYLLQHADNPVDWYPWGDEAFARAKAENKPILLSVGYAACHWCHVMAHESFEHPGTAEVMNDLFINIKVDREERPDVDDVYQHAIQLLGQGGGWPLTAFLAPDGRPFFGGTYFPGEDKYGKPAFRKVLRALHDAYKNEPESIEQNAKALLGGLAKLAEQSRGADAGGAGAGAKVPTPDEALALVALCARRLLSNHDETHGGIGTRPKFPNVSAIDLWPRGHAHEHESEYRDAFTLTLTRMAEGGIYDHLGGGFARYSTDAKWLVPHFEKMLYDQSQLVRAYLDGYRIAKTPLYKTVVEETLEYVRREMTSPEGAFYSSQDADSGDPDKPEHKEEGAFFVWTPAQLAAVLGDDLGARVASFLGVTAQGNFEDSGRSVLSRVTTLEKAKLTAGEWADARARLLAARDKRPHPGLDDKVLTSWNGMMISALAKAHEVTGDARALADARRAATFLWDTMRRPDGRLLRVWKQGRAPKILGFLDDYACFAEALLDLYEAAADPFDLGRAIELTEAACGLFWDQVRSAWYLAGNDAEALVHRPESHFDGAVPSGGAVQTSNLLRLARLVGGRSGARWQAMAEAFLGSVKGGAVNNPFGLSRSAACLDFLGTVREIVVVGPADDPATKALLGAARFVHVPARVLVWLDPGDPRRDGLLNPDLVAGKGLVGGKPAAYVCKGFTCAAPVTDVATLREALTANSGRELAKVVDPT